MSQGRVKALVNVQQMPGKQEPIYIITIESSLASLLQLFLEARVGRRCPYVHGSFLASARRGSRAAALDALKIDRTFIADMTTDPDDATTALAIINLAPACNSRLWPRAWKPRAS